MNINNLIMPLADVAKVPVSPNYYGGNAQEYITFNYADERPDVWADDSELFDKTTIQVHWYFKIGSPAEKKKLLRDYLRGRGFFISYTNEQFEEDTKYTHITVSAVIGGTDI